MEYAFCSQCCHIDVNETVDKISERLFWKGFNPLGERDRIMWNMHSAANVAHIDVNETVLEQSKLHNTPAMLIGDFNACFIEGLRNK